MIRNIKIAGLAVAATCLVFASGAGGCGEGSGGTKTTPTQSGANNNDPNEVIATADGGLKITRAQLEEKIAVPRYTEIDQRLYQLEQRYAMQIVLEELIKKKSGGMDIEEFLETEARKEPVSELEIQTLFEQSRARMGPNAELTDAMKQQIEDYIIGQRQQDYVSKLLDESNVEVLIEPPDPPRVKVSVDDDPSKGPKNAKVTIVEFSDFQCPACRQAAQILPSVLKEFEGDVRVVYRDFPLMRKHPQAFQAAIAAECADDQGKFWEYHDTLFANIKALERADLERYATDLELDLEKFNKCVDDPDNADEVKKDIADGNEIGINATPTFIVNGMMVSGANPDTLRRLIQKELGIEVDEEKG